MKSQDTKNHDDKWTLKPKREKINPDWTDGEYLRWRMHHILGRFPCVLVEVEAKTDKDGSE